jgi:hypothetical protein
LLVNGRAMMPARDLVDALGGMLHWEGGVRSVWAAFPARSQTMRLTAGSTATPVHTYAPHEADRSGGLLRVVRLDQPPLLVGGSLYVPISAVAEVAGASVRYDAENREVSVDTVFGGSALQR